MMSETMPTIAKSEILVVDDTQTSLQLLTEILNEAGYQVRPASNGALALRSIAAKLPDLILLDVKMPNMDGYEVCRRLKADEQYKDIPVIFISALNETHSKVKGFSVGGIDFITKPFEALEVLARVKTHLALQQMHRQLTKKNIQLQLEIIERKKAEAERLELETRLHQSQKIEAMGTLASGIAHDFNNLLVPILALTGLVKKNLPPASPQLKHLEMIAESAKKAKNLVNQILIVSRKAPSKMHPLHSTPIVEEVLELLCTSIPTNITFQTEIAPNLPSIQADPAQFHQVVMNLCVNAIDAMPEGGILSVSLKSMPHYQFINLQQKKTQGAFVCLTVEDTGCGMKKEILEKIFDPFFTTKERGTDKGSGLGLAMVSGIMEQHDGHIEVESQVGVGTTFRAYFPIFLASEEENQLKETQTFQNGQDLLLVQDEVSVLETEEKPETSKNRFNRRF